MKKHILSIAIFFIATGFPSLTFAADIIVQPADVPLAGPHARQQLLVLARDGTQVIGDRTATAKFTSSNTAVAKIDEAGVVTPVADGDAVITATVNGQTATAKVHVSKMKEPSPWSFRNHVVAVLTKVGCNSGACHGALAGKGGMKLSLRGYDVESDFFVLTRQVGARRVDMLEPAKSLMLLKPTRKLPHGGGLRLEADSSDYQVILDWITSGAVGPKDSDPRIERLEVFPTSAVLKPKDKLNLVVRAWYSDGHAEDVTRWARFGSSEDQVATVNEDGLVAVAGHGEAGIHATFKNRVASLTIASPFPNNIAAAEFEKSPRTNFIDQNVLAKLQALHLPPSPPCTDREFIRRTYLDAAGILPTAEEVQRFLADASPTKRAKLIDALLERPEYVDYWAYKWSDLLLVSSRKLPQQDMWSFYRFVHTSVADNKSWDQFAREVVTASGSTLQNGAA
ncbi:MAG TPA: DUF1549 domain-containing protein, partial [Gemmataceae bacterium]|nr:DUF1549 domain-containing protein [Gemmataceae bacterium]